MPIYSFPSVQPAGKPRPPSEMHRAAKSGLCYLAVSPLVWLTYVAMLFIIGGTARAWVVQAADPIIGALGRSLPIVAAMYEQLPALGVAERLPMLAHGWGAMWVVMTLMLAVQCRTHLRVAVRLATWSRLAWRPSVPWGAYLAMTLFALAGIVFFGGGFTADFTRPRPFSFVIKAYGAYWLLCYVSMGACFHFFLFYGIADLMAEVGLRQCPQRLLAWIGLDDGCIAQGDEP